MAQIHIVEHTRLSITDRLQPRSIPIPFGWVRVFLNHKLVHEGHNLVVAQGREFAAQRLFNTTNGTSNPDWTSYIVSHFGIGSGGATVSGDSVTLNGPDICDTHLYEPISLGDTSYLNDPYSYDAGDGIHKNTDAVKPITASGGSITLIPGNYENCTYYSTVKCICIVPSGEPIQLNAGESVEVSEAALYFVSGSDARMFAHICFPPKWKAKEDVLTIEWHIIC